MFWALFCSFPHNEWVRTCLLLLASLIAWSPLSFARNQASTTLDPDYISALATANRFLYAWQNQDQEAGLILLTQVAKRDTTEDRVDAFFVPGPGTQRSYEITRGRRLRTGRYSFPVTLLEHGPNRKGHPKRYSQIVVIRTGKDDWAIDKLP